MRKCDFLKVVNDRIQLKRSQHYYAQINGQLAIAGHHHTHFVVFTNKDIVVEYTEFDKKMLPNLIVFFKTYAQPYLLGITQIFVCLMCDDPCLNINDFETVSKVIHAHDTKRVMFQRTFFVFYIENMLYIFP